MAHDANEVANIGPSICEVNKFTHKTTVSCGVNKRSRHICQEESPFWEWSG